MVIPVMIFPTPINHPIHSTRGAELPSSGIAWPGRTKCKLWKCPGAPGAFLLDLTISQWGYKGDVMEYTEYTGINITLCNLGVSENRAYHDTGNFIRESMMHKQILGYHTVCADKPIHEIYISTGKNPVVKRCSFESHDQGKNL